jgi:hypothetical protein
MPYIRDEKQVSGNYSKYKNEERGFTKFIKEDSELFKKYLTPKETYIQKRLKSMDEGGYGTNGERWSYIYDNGFDKLKEYDKGVKDRFPKP